MLDGDCLPLIDRDVRRPPRHCQRQLGGTATQEKSSFGRCLGCEVRRQRRNRQATPIFAAFGDTKACGGVEEHVAFAMVDLGKTGANQLMLQG